MKIENITTDPVIAEKIKNILSMMNIRLSDLDPIPVVESEASRKARFSKALKKYKEIEAEVKAGKTDLKPGAKISVDGFVFVV